MPALQARKPQALSQGRALLYATNALSSGATTPQGNMAKAGRNSRNTAFSCARSRRLRECTACWKNSFAAPLPEAARSRGITGETLLILLERRLDNVAYRLGFAGSRAEARTLVRHGHVTVNGKKVNIPSYTVRVGDVVSVKEPSRQITRVLSAMEGSQRRGVPDWAEVDRDACSGRIKLLPSRSDITMPINEKLIVELYSK